MGGPPSTFSTFSSLARHSLFGRYMKAQPRLAGDRRKPCRNGLGSDIPMECVTLLGQCVGLPIILATCEYLRDLSATCATDQT